MTRGRESALKKGAVWRFVSRNAPYGIVGASAICGFLGVAAAAEIPTPAPHPARNFNTYSPTGVATRIAASEAPVIDGDPSDAAWAKARPIDEFYEVDPNPGEPATETTIARFLYDDNNLYVSIYAYDREPDKIVATVMARDGNLDVDDGVRIFIDPGLTRRDSYYFEVNALGSRVDALTQNNSAYFVKWNAIWEGRAKRQPDGFSVEMAIPFRDLSFNPANSNWGLEIQRRVRRTGERIRWSNIRAAAYYADVSRSGTLTGITDVSQGLGLDIQLYGKVNYKKEWQAPKSEGVNFVTSGNAYYKITPGLTGTVTVDPDFSDSPLDIRQVNTTRFVLFQPETRDFFLQDTPIFEYAGRSYLSGDGISRDNGRPFFSRNVGIANGEPVSIIGGGKLSGQYAGFNIGALSVVTNGNGITTDKQVLSVARITRQVFGESKLGMILTNGDPSGASKNTVAGADFQYLNSNFTPGKVAQGDFFYARSMSKAKGDDDTYGVSLNYPNEPYGGEAHFKQLGTNYLPAMGFVNRTGIRQYDGIVTRRDRNAGWRFFDLTTTWNVITGLDNHIQSRENMVETAVSTGFTDEFHARIYDDYEDVPVPFTIASKVPVPAGNYHWTNVDGYIRTSDGRPYTARLEVMCCHYYNGNYWRIDLQGDWRPIPFFEVQPRYTYTFIGLPTGSIGIHLLTSNFIVNFTPDMQLYTQVQFDNVSQNFAFSMRYRWEYSPGDEIFILLGQAAQIPGTTFTPQISQAAIRIGHTFRF
jgi:hypothetical protein